MTIHSTDPFETPEQARSPVRRLRGRLPSAVTVWTAYYSDRRPAGLTVSSTVVVDGAPGKVLGVVDDESTLWEAVRQTGRFAVVRLGENDRQLADAMAGLMPAPGGVFASGSEGLGGARSWHDTDYGPVLDGAGAWAGCRLDDARQLGWGLLMEATIENVEIGAEVPPLVYYRRRYRALADR